MCLNKPKKTEQKHEYSKKHQIKQPKSK